MIDRTVKILLGMIVLLLLALLVKPSVVTRPVRAQAAGLGAIPQPVMSVSNNAIYVLQANQLSVYMLDFGAKGPFAALELLDDAKRDDVLKNMKLKLLLRQELPDK
jgi:hypothetical protein